MLRIQYASDIHLEFLKKIPKIEVMADVLCLAGDIGYPFSGIYKDFLVKMSTSFKKVFLIAGNHEYYSKQYPYTMPEIQEKIAAVLKDNQLTNVTYLNNSTEEYQGYTFVGTTLWSNIAHLNVHDTTLMNDFYCIDKMDFNQYTILHRTDCNFLSKVITSATPDKKLVVMTHHLPSFDFISDKYKDSKYNTLNCFFASNMELLFQPPVKAWIYGHTHTRSVNVKNNIIFACNPKGYPTESQVMTFPVLKV